MGRMTDREAKRIQRGGMPRRVDDNFDHQLRELSASGVRNGLPVVHVTSAWAGKEIVRIHTIKANHCRVFKRDLAYFFVLRPAYCLKGGEEAPHFVDYFPAAFVLRPESVSSPRHIYPFDTGAAYNGVYSGSAHRQVPLDDYELHPDHAKAAGFIGWAFGNLERYYEGRLRPGVEEGLAITDSVALSYIAIARLGLDGSREHDKRASTLEVASFDNVELLENAPLIIFPKGYLEDRRLRPHFDKLRDSGAHLEPYDWKAHRTPNQFQKDLMEICRNWYRAQGYEL